MYDKSYLFERPLSKENNLLKCFEEIHDFIYSHDGLSTQQTLEEFVKILFVKIFDEQLKENQFIITDDEWNRVKSGEYATNFTNRIT
ncbi:MAG: hypothetical protein LBB88_02410, partial [Planctomycetaceae bacterium]|nr:hypothetical protein [Planctomycetaceae bacterium]